MSRSAVLLVSCPDRPGIVAAVSNFVFQNGGNVLALDQHSEVETDMFFMRLVWDDSKFSLDRDATTRAIGDLGRPFEFEFELSYSDSRRRAAIFASRTPHCLYDLLQTHQLGELGGDIALVISNHDELRSVAEHFEVPFAHVPVAGDRKAFEPEQRRLLNDAGVDLIVLARYMQILSAEFVAAWHGRVINVHHSFLPSFVGAQAYRQAKERGVKMVGATAHYVTDALDQGPIIEQDVARISHRDGLQDVVRKGRDLERRVLTRATRLHFERRVIVSGNRTIVFES